MTYRAVITGSRESTSPEATFYHVNVSCSDGSSWTLEHRYSQFAALHEKLEKKYGVTGAFPRKHLIRSHSSTVIEERKHDLGRFLSDYAIPNTDKPDVRQFLQLDRDGTAPPAEEAEVVADAPPPNRSIFGCGGSGREPEPAAARERAPSAAERIKAGRANQGISPRGVPDFMDQREARRDTLEVEPLLPIGFQRTSTRNKHAAQAKIQDPDAHVASSDLPIGFRRASVYGQHDDRWG
eukprot:TRINITY_DN10272_c0_g1_i1.p1 TRINITY_DN10272_c0_g1~~TRINITY_DN10272_c0_g1_i1.p1  ORF type:complete len:238 (+),score=31.86 TRINITY_DN10272_c0_g1_i1:187-900(+)